MNYITKEQANKVLKDMLVNIGGESNFVPVFTKEEYYFNTKQHFPLVEKLDKNTEVIDQGLCQDVLCYLLPLEFGMNKFNKNSSTAKLQVLEVIEAGKLDKFDDLKCYLALNALLEFDKLIAEYAKYSATEKKLTNISSGVYMGYSIDFLRGAIGGEQGLCHKLYVRVARFEVIKESDLEYLLNYVVEFIDNNYATKGSKDELLTVVADEMFKSKYYEIIRQSKSNPDKFIDFDNVGIFERTEFINDFVIKYNDLV